MVASQLSENIADLHNLEVVNSLIEKGSVHEHPKVRFAAAHALGQISDDLKPHYQQMYFDLMFPTILLGIDDPVERVATHWYGCLSNFIYEFKELNKVEAYVQAHDLIQRVEKRVHCGCSHVKEVAINALSSAWSIPHYFDASTVEQAMHLLGGVLSTYDVNGPYNKLIGETI